MGKYVSLHHRTAYRYDKAVTLGPQIIQLRPTSHCKTPILSYSLEVAPADRILHWQVDPHANHLARLFFPAKTTEFIIDVKLIADLTPVNPFAFFLEPGFENYPFQYPPELAKDLEPYLSMLRTGPLLRGLVTSLAGKKQSTVAFLVAANQRVRDEVGYVTRLEHGVQSAEETLEKHSGSCRDSAWLLVQLFRQMGIAARFVSGYLIQLAADEPPSVGSESGGPTVDSAELHAWAEVFLPGAGWIGMDPTSGLFAAEGHIPLACTPNAAQAAPIIGTVEPSGVHFSYTSSVRRIEEAPLLSKPFAETDWERVRKVAHRIDRDLEAQDVRLTMGGEPTFVGIDEPESTQWNIEALGPLKRTRALTLIRCLREKTAPGALLHFGQGKWYPGEPLPRWAFHCVSRVDGVPIWENGDLIALEDRQYGFGVNDALAFLESLTRRLQVGSDNILPAYNPGEQSEEPAGYILPLRRRQPAGVLAWSSQLWFPPPDRLVLSPGDSPIGYRITTEAMPWVAPDELVYEFEEGDASRPPDARRVKLPPYPARRHQLFAVEPSPDPLPPLSTTAETATELIRPSLCVESREGRLHVFLPYVGVAADYLDLVAAIEDTCQHLGKAVWIEGYTAPFDTRLRPFSLTPDPGVLEVNLPPAANWDELEQINAVLHEEATRNRLISSKFAYDGSHLATGGGSHIVIGGPALTDSPLLRRPDLLRSMVAFWQNHPSLSYLFSGMYVGPTSQYPRVDEARVDALYELEVAFSQLPEEGCPPYIVDGLFRNLLVDVTGNSHRAEFCIDKLFPPPGLGLQLGLLELRAFEMAPQYQMGLVEMLLVRALVAIFWREPYTGGLLRWGTALHDRFMLPHFVQRDFAEVVGYIQRAGYDFDEGWFASHREFRFPRIGSIAADGVTLELRQALEPWNVLAEETTSGGTVRSVDSSLERMQVKLTGLTTDGRYVVTCNGRRVPLHPTGAPGESVAGIRFRARKLSASLHPTIPVHTPLVFTLIDAWTQRVVGRCTYHARPADGSIYTTRPANAAEARERRLKRFEVNQPDLGAIRLPADERNPIFPLTLDLRWPASAHTELLESGG
jgi:uncharacterized protein (DUF2126 family)/transglutaminase-like putative cysteine protease